MQFIHKLSMCSIGGAMSPMEEKAHCRATWWIYPPITLYVSIQLTKLDEVCDDHEGGHTCKE